MRDIISNHLDYLSRLTMNLLEYIICLMIEQKWRKKIAYTGTT